MDNFYDPTTREWVTDWTRYDAVLSEPRFAPIRNHEFERWTAERTWDLLMTFLHAVPDDTVPLVGSGPLENLINARGADFIDRLETDLPLDSRLRAAILEVNLTRGTLSPMIERRLVAAAGPTFSLLEPDSA